jgi:hypothetical protein
MCALTLIEKKIRQKINGNINADKDCFTCKIIEPVYNFKNNNKDRSKFIYATAVSLWFISLYRLYIRHKSGKIKNFYDLLVL